jgi:hypothetical protein
MAEIYYSADCSIISENLSLIKDCLDVKRTRVLDHLIESHAIDKREKDFITSKTTLVEQAEETIDIILRKGPAEFKAFMLSLHETHSYLYSQLREKLIARDSSAIERFPPAGRTK